MLDDADPTDIDATSLLSPLEAAPPSSITWKLVAFGRRVLAPNAPR